VGKSTIFEGLVGRDGRIRPMPILRRSPYVIGLVWHLAGVVITLTRHRALSRQWTMRGLVMMAYLQALPRALRARGLEIVIFDQGPIFFLTRPLLLDERLGAWWQRTFERWSSILDVVVWLEAPDPVLLERIDARSKHHRIKGRRDQAALDVLAESRRAYSDALARLEGQARAPMILRFDTSLRSADEVVDEVLTRLALLEPASARAGR
jgi:anion-transporting  ArsA/GET3 family ATPase